jgi:PDZ domain-containing secreted protein/Zn-dependent protease
LKGTVRLFRVKGIPVNINWTWLFVFVLVFWSLATGLFPATYPGLSGSTYLVMALVATVLFFGSILVHELSHALRSLREGVRVREITLWLFGGVSRIEGTLPTPGAELRVTAAGPAASAALALAFVGLTALFRAAGWPDGVVGVADYLARINGLLLAFNLVPALPLDGGRILHSLLWHRTGDKTWATVAAAHAGRAFGLLLIAIGLLGLFTGSGIGAIWFVFLGWFLLQAVNQEISSAQLEQAVTGLRVRDLMAPDPVSVAPHTSIEQFSRTVARRSPHGAYPVVDQERLVGLLSAGSAAAVRRRDRASVTVADVMLTGDRVPVVGPDDQMLASLDALQREPRRAVVLDGARGDEVVGILSTTDVEHALEVAPRRGKPPVSRRRGTFAIWLGVALAFLVAAGLLYHPPYVVISPGETFDVGGDITITGTSVQRPTGRYLATSVQVNQPTALGALVAALRSDREVVPLGDVVPSDVSPSDLDRHQRELFADSQQTAAAAAATAAGYRASLTGEGAEVVGTLRSAPAASVLEAGDVITAVDGMAVRTVSDFRDSLAGHAAGERVTLTVRREGETRTIRIETARLPQVSGGTGIGVMAQTKDVRVVLPFRVTFRSRPDVGGPSAGLAYALALTDMLDSTDDARSRTVAATGTIDADGSVGAVGGVHEKAIAARDAGADVFVVPAEELSSVDGNGLQARGVEDLTQAVHLLQAA